MLKTSVSDELFNVILKLMNEPLLEDFLLGGGTNLPIKYNHRISTDIDLFSTFIVGTKKLNLICQYIENGNVSTFALIEKPNAIGAVVVEGNAVAIADFYNHREPTNTSLFLFCGTP